MGQSERCRDGARWLLIALLGVFASHLLGTPANVAAQGTPSPIVVTWQTSDGGAFRTIVEDLDAIARITDAFGGDGIAGVPIGTLLAGDGGVNAPMPGIWRMSRSQT